MYPHPPTEKPLRDDEERTLLSEEVLNGGNRQSLPTHVQRNDSEEVHQKLGDSLTSAGRTAWQRFNGYGRRHIGFFRSLKAVVLSSCTFTHIVVTVVLRSTSDSRLEHIVDSHTTRLDFSLSRVGSKEDFYACVLPF